MTDNHGYHTPRKGVTNWHIPLNKNFENIDTDVEIRDREENRSSYRPKEGAKFLAVDTENAFVGDGDRWLRLDSRGRRALFESVDANEASISDLDGARIVRDISKLNDVIREVSGSGSTTSNGGTTVYLAPPVAPEDPDRPLTHFPEGERFGDRVAGVIGKTGVVVEGLVKPEFVRGPMQGTGQNQVMISARDMPEGTPTSSGGDPRNWPTVLYPEPALPDGGDGGRSVGAQFRNVSIDGEGRRVNGYYARNCDKSVVAGVDVRDTVGFAFGWSGAFSTHAYRVGCENCGSVRAGTDFGSPPFGASPDSELVPGVPAVYAQEGQDSLGRNVNVRVQGFFQGNGDDSPTQVLSGPGGTFKLTGDKKYRSGAIIRNCRNNPRPRAVVDIRGNRVENYNITGGSGECVNIVGVRLSNDTVVHNLRVEKLPEGIRFGANPTHSPPITDLVVEQISSNGRLDGDAIRVQSADGGANLPDIADSLFNDIGGAVVRYDAGNPGSVRLCDCRFDSIGGYLIDEKRGSASGDSYKRITGRAFNLDRGDRGLEANGVTNVPEELSFVDLPGSFRNVFFDVVSAGDGDTIDHGMDVEPDLVTLTTESSNVVGIRSRGSTSVEVSLVDLDGNPVSAPEPIHCSFRHVSAMRQTRNERTTS